MYLSTANILSIWLSGVYRRVVSVSKNLIKSTSIHINYDKLPLMDSTNKKLGKALELNSDLLVPRFTKLEDVKRRCEKDKVKQKINAPSLRDKKPKSSGNQKTTGKSDKKYKSSAKQKIAGGSPRAKKSKSSGKPATSKKAVHEDAESDAEGAEMESIVVENEPVDNEPVDNNAIEHSELYKLFEKRDPRWSSEYDTVDFYSDMTASSVQYAYWKIMEMAVFGESEGLRSTEVLDKLKELDAQHRGMVFEK
jgi:hypothetical protein